MRDARHKNYIISSLMPLFMWLMLGTFHIHITVLIAVDVQPSQYVEDSQRQGKRHSSTIMPVEGELIVFT